MVLPVFRELIPYEGTLQRLGLMDCRHPWRAGETVTWSIPETPSLRIGREGEGSHEIQNATVEHRRVQFRMKEIVTPVRSLRMGEVLTEERLRALALEAGRLADLAFIREFRPWEPDSDPEVPRRERRRGFWPDYAGFWPEMARRFHEAQTRRTILCPSVPPAIDPIVPLATTAPAGPQTVAAMERYLNENLLAAAGTPRGAGHAWYDCPPSEDRKAPAHAKPLAPLPDWLKKVDELIEGTRR